MNIQILHVLVLNIVIFILNENNKVNSEEILNFTENEEQQILGEEVLGFLGISQPKQISQHLSLRNSAMEFLMGLYEDNPSSSNNEISRSARSSNNLLTDEDILNIEKCNNIMTFLSEGNSRIQSLTEFKFNMHKLPKELDLHKAELKIYKIIPPYNDHLKDTRILQINVFLEPDKVLDKNTLVDRINVTSNYHGWLEINVTKALLKWHSNKKNNFGLYIKINTLEGEFLLSKDAGLVSNSQDEQHMPFIVGCFTGPEVVFPTKSHRPKRSLKNAYVSQRFQMPKTCERLNFTVHFKQLGWTWIIAPEKFEAYFCSGECTFPLGASVSPTNHAIVQTLMHLKNPHLPRPHCAPTKLTSISVVYYLDDNTANYKVFRQIVAEKCGCQ